MNIFPHEARFAIDSVVVRRYPDRMVPRSDPTYNWVRAYARGPVSIYPSEMNIDPGELDAAFFEAHKNDCSGCWPDRYSNPAAHHLVDYVKVWDLPDGYNLQAFPQ